MTSTETYRAELEDPEFVRVPGLYRDWEIPQLVKSDCVLRVEAAGEAEDGTPLYAVYRRRVSEPEASE